MDKFDWENFYSEDNGEIIKKLSDATYLPLEKFIEMLSLDNVSCKKSIKPHIFGELIKEGKLQNGRLALDRLINKQIIPITIKRLPRNLELAIGSDHILKDGSYNKDYYLQHEELYSLIVINDSEAIDELVKTPTNYSADLPLLWSYEELKERWKNKERLEIFSECNKRRLGAYMKVSHRASSQYSVRQYYKEEMDLILSIYNCGNPYYTKRYQGLERLIMNDVGTLFHNSRILQPSTVCIFPLQSTDLETKYHIRRNLEWLGDQVEITLDQIFFLREEVIAIEEEEERAKIKTNNNLISSPFFKTPEKNSESVYKKFIWDDFYNIKNAKILEDLLDHDCISVEEFFLVFFSQNKCLSDKVDKIPFLNQEALEEFFRRIFNQWADKLNTQKITSDPFVEILHNPNEKENVRGTSLLKFDATLNLLIREGYFPKSLRRLPRRRNPDFDVLPNYYPELEEDYQRLKNTNNLSEFIKNPKNYSNQKPSIYTFSDLKNRWKDQPSNKIFIECYEGRLSPYLEVSEKNIVIGQFFEANRLSFYREYNSGNPSYTKRYKGLEKLYLTGNNNFSLEALENSDELKLHSHLLQILQSTDIEMKFHIARTLKFFNGKNHITIYDLVFLVKEVENIEKNQPQKQSSISSDANISTINEAAKSLGAKGALKANDSHKIACNMAKNEAKRLWGVNPDLTKKDVAYHVLKYLKDNKILNRGNEYAFSTVEDWITTEVPKAKKRGGRPSYK